jgi:hypothetical protein
VAEVQAGSVVFLRLSDWLSNCFKYRRAPLSRGVIPNYTTTEKTMPLDVRDQTIEQAHVTRNEHTSRTLAERHVFHTIEHVGKRTGTHELKQRIAAVVIAVLICTALYAAVVLDMHFSK